LAAVLIKTWDLHWLGPRSAGGKGQQRGYEYAPAKLRKRCLEIAHGRDY
jgi:hypothetical protein